MSDIVLSPPKTDDIIESHTKFWSDDKKKQYSDYIAQQHINYEPRIKMKDNIVVKHQTSTSFLTVRKNQHLKVKKKKYTIENVIDEPYYSLFSPEDGTLKRKSTGFDAVALFESISKGNDKDFIPSATNMELNDNNDNQTLTHQDINKMKDEGATGDEIIRAVAAASKTFESKSEFSQEKWLRKKQAKYSQDVIMQRSTPSMILNSLYEKDPRKIMYLRDDTLAQMLQYANVGAGNRTLVLESTTGLITGAVAYRQGGEGEILYGHTAPQPQMNLIEEMDLSIDDKEAIIPFPLAIIPSLQSFKYKGVTSENMLQHFNDEYMISKKKAMEEKKTYTEDTILTLTPFQEHQQKARLSLYEGAHSLIMATQHAILELLVEFLPFLLPSSPIVIYSPTFEQLARVQDYLIKNKVGVNVIISECWYRHMQVLPNRTHPLMTINASGGYLLVATYVKSEHPVSDL